MSDPYREAAKKRIQEIDAQSSKLRLEREEIVDLMQSTCEHEQQEDLTSTCGRDADDGYGHWWRNPYFRCKDCGKVSESYGGFHG